MEINEILVCLHPRREINLDFFGGKNGNKQSLRKVVDIAISAFFQPLQKLLLNLVINPGSNQSLLLAPSLPSLNLALEWNKFLLPLESELSHANEILGDFDESLLTFLTDKAGPEYLTIYEFISNLACREK